MTSRAEKLIAPPRWGAARERGERRASRAAPRAARRGRWAFAAADLAGAALVLCSTIGLWAAFVAAVW